MKKLLFVFVVALGCTNSYAGPYDWSLGMTSDSKTVTLSTTVARPTQLCTQDSNVQRTWIVTSSSFTIFISSVSTNLSTSTTNGSFSITGPATANANPVLWSPDGVNAPYEGALFAVASNTQSPPTISIFRSK